MYADSVAKILCDVTTPQKVVRKVLRENGMQIVKKFSPVNSEYKFQIGDNKRITMRVLEDEFFRKEENLISNQWKTSQEMHIWDTPSNLENTLVKSISDILDMGAKFIPFKNIK